MTGTTGNKFKTNRFKVAFEYAFNGDVEMFDIKVGFSFVNTEEEQSVTIVLKENTKNLSDADATIVIKKIMNLVFPLATKTIAPVSAPVLTIKYTY